VPRRKFKKVLVLLALSLLPEFLDAEVCPCNGIRQNQKNLLQIQQRSDQADFGSGSHPNEQPLQSQKIPSSDQCVSLASIYTITVL